MESIIQCNTCGFYYLTVPSDEERSAHTQDHVVLNQSAPEYVTLVVDHEEYMDYFDGGKENYMQYQSEMSVGYMGGTATYSQWWIHTESLSDDDTES